MARTTRKARSTTSAIRRHYSGSSGEREVLQRIEARSRQRLQNFRNGYRSPKNVLDVAIEAIETHAAPPWRPVGNPNATLMGLATELRLEIYAYLSDSRMVHVHKRRGRYTWTPCKGTNPTYPLLCHHPRWSGLCPETERCSYKHAETPEPRGFWGLAATCKLVHEEMEHLFMKETCFSIHPAHMKGWLTWLDRRAPKQLHSITKVTFAGPDHRLHSPSHYTGTLEAVEKALPNLEAIGYQCQTPQSTWITKYYDLYSLGRGLGERDHWASWHPFECLDIFAPTITVVVEGMVWWKPEEYHHEYQGIIRVVRDGKQERYKGSGCEDDDVKLEVVQPQRIAYHEGKDPIGWELWWETEQLQAFGARKKRREG